MNPLRKTQLRYGEPTRPASRPRGKASGAPQWPPHPTIYEINTWVWLAELPGGHPRRPIPLDKVPDAVWDEIAALGVDAVWLMGVWERSPRGRAIARANTPLLDQLRVVLPDLDPDVDIVGSAYCIKQYQVDPALGGDAALAAAREALAARGVGLVLDFVPNHTALDCPWAETHRERYLPADEADLYADALSFARAGHRPGCPHGPARGAVLALGKDPYFPAWNDVAQLHAFAPAYREAAVTTLQRIASQCDAVRCDMAMLMMTEVFANTWGERAGEPPETEFWEEVIPAVRATHPHVRFIAEAYWDLEWRLQQQGFHYCYDKNLYDILRHAPDPIGPPARQRLDGDPAFQNGMVRFLENHDEDRAADAFEPHRMAALFALTCAAPGATLVHEGQLEGRRVRVPVHLGRRPLEPGALGRLHPERVEVLRQILRDANHPTLTQGQWRLCEVTTWPDNRSGERLVAFTWRQGDDRRLVVVNLAETPSQAMVHLGFAALASTPLLLRDTVTAATHRVEPTGERGLFVELPAFGFHFFHVGPAPEEDATAA